MAFEMKEGVGVAVATAAYGVRSVPLGRLAVLGPMGRGADATRRRQGGHDWGSLAGVVGRWQGGPRGHRVLLGATRMCVMEGGAGRGRRLW